MSAAAIEPRLPFELRTVRSLVAIAAEEAKTTADQLLGTSRRSDIVKVRWAVVEAANTVAPTLSLERIGRALNRHHTTIMSGRKQARRLSQDPDFANLVRAIVDAYRREKGQ